MGWGAAFTLRQQMCSTCPLWVRYGLDTEAKRVSAVNKRTGQLLCTRHRSKRFAH